MPHLLFMMPVISLSVRQGAPFGFLNCFKVISFIAETTSGGRGCVSMSIFFILCTFFTPFAFETARISKEKKVSRSEIISRLGLSVALRTASETWSGVRKHCILEPILSFFCHSLEKDQTKFNE